jgi:hypothetical protein
MPTIDEAIKILSASIKTDQNAHNLQMTLHVAESIFLNEILSEDQSRKIQIIIGSLNRKYDNLIKMERLTDEVINENKVVANKLITSKDIVKWSLGIDDEIKNDKKIKNEKVTKEAIGDFRDAAVSPEKFNLMIKLLKEKKVIDSEHCLIGTATVLYSLIKRFVELGYFKKIFRKDLYPLVNEEFKINTVFQTWNAAEPYSQKLF